MNILIPDYISKVINMLESAGYEAFVVGGCVRDSIIGRTPYDWDVTTSAVPDEMKAVFADMRVIETGIEHGTLTVISDGQNVEITTYRIDGEYLDSRRPENVTFTRSIKEDLARRDFTVNAMAYSESRGLIDFFGGQEDLEKKIIRAVGDPNVRFDEDALRILRALRFAAVLGFEIDADTDSALRKLCYKLEFISAERKYAELTKLICGEYCEDIMKTHNDVLSKIIPELEPALGFNQQHPYQHLNLWEHLCKTVAVSENDISLRYAALLHDIAKPLCKNVQSGVAFYEKHEILATVIADSIMTNLKAPSKIIFEVQMLVKFHEYNVLPYPSKLKRMLKEMGEEIAVKVIKLKRADLLAQKPDYIHRAEMLDYAEDELNRILESGECYNRSMLKINGDDAAELGFKGAEIKEALEKILDDVIDEAIPNERPQLLEALKELKG